MFRLRGSALVPFSFRSLDTVVAGVIAIYPLLNAFLFQVPSHEHSPALVFWVFVTCFVRSGRRPDKGLDRRKSSRPAKLRLSSKGCAGMLHTHLTTLYDSRWTHRIDHFHLVFVNGAPRFCSSASFRIPTSRKCLAMCRWWRMTWMCGLTTVSLRQCLESKLSRSPTNLAPRYGPVAWSKTGFYCLIWICRRVLLFEGPLKVFNKA